MTQKIAIASDHAAFALKETIKAHLSQKGYDVLDLGPDSDDRVDYPDFGFKLAQAIVNKDAPLGIGLCGSGIGIDIALNRFADVRSALCHSIETARLARSHNDANVISLGARILDEKLALDCIDVFLTTEFEGGRHARRVEKLGTCGA